MAAKNVKIPKKDAGEARSDELLDLAHIPFSLRDPVLKMTSESAISGNLPTIFVGIVDEQYNEGTWKKHVARISQLFRIDNSSYIGEIMAKARGQNRIDGEELARQMTSAIDVINTFGVDTIRLVGLGVHGAIALHQSLESLIRGWDTVPWSQKTVQFVALDDSQDSAYLNFCKAPCLKQLCGSVQFYKTMDYNDYGFLEMGVPNIGDLSGQLEKLLAKQQNSAARENSKKE